MARDDSTSDSRRSSLAGVLLLTFLASLGTGVFWHGLSFIAKHTYGFDQPRNLVLYAVMGVIYTAGAFRAGRLTRAAARRLSPRGVLAACLALQAVACTVPLLARSEWTLWFCAGTVTFLSSVIWPIVESYLTAGRHGPQMRRAIGWFNLTWMPATALSLIVMAPFVERHGRWAMAGLTVANVVALLGLRLLAARPDEHDPVVRAGHVTDEYPHLLRAARVLLPVSYFLTTALTPILPFRFEALGVAVENETRLTSVWMFVRIVAVLIMWRTPFWHGRWGTLLLGAAAMTSGFVLVVLAPTVPVIIGGFVCLGVGIGCTYYAALYYAMAVGSAEVDAGGTHEALIGIGYTTGPLAGLAGTLLGGGGRLVALVCVLAGAAGVPAMLPYLRARRRRAAARRAARQSPRSG